MKNVIRMKTAGLREVAGLLSGMVLGGLAGFLAMLLFAPRSGENTRARIWQKSAQLQHRATGTFDELVVMSKFDNRKILVSTRA